MSDEDIGGFSKAQLDWVPFPSNEPRRAAPSPPNPPSPASSLGYARLHGHISTRLPPNRPDIHRSGYAAFRTRNRPPTIFGKALWDIDPYVYLALRVRSDGRAWFVNVQTESLVPSDLHQHRLLAKRPGRWETVLIKWNDFVRTNHGFLVEPQSEILRRRVKSIGLGLIDRVEGPFDLCIESVWATNDAREATVDVEVDEKKTQDEEAERTATAVSDAFPSAEIEAGSNTSGASPGLEEGQQKVKRVWEAGDKDRPGMLKNKHGEKVSWRAGAGR